MTNVQRRQRYWLYVLDLFIIAAVAGLLAFGIRAASDNAAGDTAGCTRESTMHEVGLQDDRFMAGPVSPVRCDMLRITNNDTKPYKLAFGSHDHHVTYPGFTERTLQPGETTTLRLARPGTYRLHDHLRDNASLEMHIKNR